LIQSIDDLIPKKLDDIIRKNRELMELGLSTPEEMLALKTEIQQGLPIKDIIDDWCLISLRSKRSGEVKLLLLGQSQKKNVAWMTSSIVRIDQAQSIVVTKSGSLYGLGSRGNGEPSRGLLMHVCVTFHKWGSGEFLGVPHFFY
jgi:hypothetical protein